MSWLVLTFPGILAFSPKSLSGRVLMKDDPSDPYARSVAFFGPGRALALLSRFSTTDFSTTECWKGRCEDGASNTYSTRG